MANPTGPGKHGTRDFVSDEFDAGSLAATAGAAVGVLLLVSPGLALFYCGALAVPDPRRALGAALLTIPLLSLLWALWGYSLAFAPNWGAQNISRAQIDDPEGFRIGTPLIGGPDYLALHGLTRQVGGDMSLYPVRHPSDNVPHLLLMALQMAIFVTAAVPLTVALASHLKPVALAVFLLLWGTLVYAPLAHWVWGPGWLRRMGALDFAGATTIHIGAGLAALACAAFIRRPDGESLAARRIEWAYTPAGAVLLWAGTMVLVAARPFAQGDPAIIADALVSVHLAACSGMAGWAGLEWIRRGRTTIHAASLGIFAGLVVAAAGGGYFAPQSSLIVGFVGGALGSVIWSLLHSRIAKRDSLGVFALQGVLGACGILFAGVFATSGKSLDGRTIGGLITGDSSQILVQAAAAGATMGWAFVGGLVSILLASLACGFRPLRASDEIARAGISEGQT